MLSLPVATLRRYANDPHPWYPDWSLRYQPLLRHLAGNGPLPARILEVGSNLFGLGMFLQAPPLVNVDLAFARVDAAVPRRGRPIAGSVTALPLRDGSIDQVVCIDTLEHLDPADRPAAAGELLRVLRPGGRAWIAFPCGERAQRFDRRLREEVASRGGRIDWLEEHMAHPFPTASAFRENVREAAGTLGYDVTLRESKHGSLVYQWAHIRLLIGARNWGLNVYLRALLKALVPLTSRLSVGPCYRRAFVVERVR